MSNNIQNIFSAGHVWATLNFDANGNEIAIPQTFKIGTLTESSLSITADLKKLMGSDSQFAVSAARGAMAITGNIKFGSISGNVFDLFFGQGIVKNLINSIKNDTVGTVIGSGLTVTVTPPNSGDFTGDLGVESATTGLPYVKVASSPTTGQYAVNATTGVYTFASADEAKKVYISYKYQAEVNNSVVLDVDSLPMGSTPYFSIDFYETFEGKPFIIHLPKCVATKIDFATKTDDYTIPSLDFEAISVNGSAISVSAAN